MTNKQATLYPIIGCIIWILTRLWSMVITFSHGLDFFDLQYMIFEILYLMIPICFIIFFITLYKSLK